MSEPQPFFIGTADTKGHIAFDFPKVVTAYVGRKFAGKMVEVEIREYGDKRSDRQNRGFHAMVSPWAKQEGWRVDALKIVLLKTVFGTSEMVNPATGEVEDVPNELHTSGLKMRQFCELIDRTMDIAAEQGHVLVAPDEWRRQKEALRKQAERAAAKAARAALRQQTGDGLATCSPGVAHSREHSERGEPARRAGVGVE